MRTISFTDAAEQTERARRFHALHERPGAFAIPNPWDAGSAKLLAAMGFEALATTSAGYAFSIGKPDSRGAVTRDETFENVRAIVAATSLPVSADLENGFGDDPASCAETIRMAARAGLVGGSIEDATGRADAPIYPFEQAVERVAAAVEAARGLPFAFTLTARAENLLHGRIDLPDTLRRLQAYAEAGADVLYAPGVKTPQDIAAVVKAVAPRPVNVVMGLAGAALSMDELARLGVKRVSVGSALARAAYGEFLRSARELREQGTFGFAKTAVPFAEINAMFE
jgi:2-methylisocitrate lyase-like PEP mutase family enzyme